MLDNVGFLKRRPKLLLHHSQRSASVTKSHENVVNILIADTPEEFVTAVGKLMEEDLYKRIAANCRKTYEEEFSAEVVKEKIKGVIRKLSSGGQDE